MGIKEFNHLKESLSKIEENNRKSLDDIERKKKIHKRIGELSRQISETRTKISSDSDISEMKTKLSQLKESEIRHIEVITGMREEVQVRSRWAAFPELSFEEAEVRMREQSKRKREKIGTLAIVLLVLTGCFLTINTYLKVEENYSPWTCDNGEVIHQDGLLDGENDCSDGSDEAKSGFWDDLTRAESDEDSHEMAAFIVAGLVAATCWWIFSRIDEWKKDDSINEMMFPDYVDEKFEFLRKKEQISIEETSIRRMKDQIKSISSEITKQAQTLPSRLESYQTKHNNLNKESSDLQRKIEVYERDNEVLWEGIAHLIPHSDLVRSV